jgi:hypothetical protein
MWRRFVLALALSLAPALAHAKLSLDVTGQPDGDVVFAFSGSGSTLLPARQSTFFMDVPALEPLGDFRVDPFDSEAPLFIGTLSLNADGNTVSAARFVAHVAGRPPWPGEAYALTIRLRADTERFGEAFLPATPGGTIAWSGRAVLPAAAAGAFADVVEPTTTDTFLRDVATNLPIAPVEITISEVPVPAALPLMGTAVAALGWWRHRRRRVCD